MTRPLSVLTAAALLFSSCATQKFGDAIIYGRTKDVTDADVRAAIAARTSLSRMAHVYEIEVVNRDRIRLYLIQRGHGGDICVEMVRVRGKWRDQGMWMSEVM